MDKKPLKKLSNLLLTIQIAIYPAGGLDETYLFVLKPDETLEVSIGERKSLNSSFMMSKIDETKQKQLTIEESKTLLDLMNKIYEKSEIFQKYEIDDSWDLSINYKGKIIETNYNSSESKELDALVNQLIKLSPIVVDLHGWS